MSHLKHDQNKGGWFKMVDIEVRVVNNQGEDVSHNGKEQGEIIVKGHGVLSDNTQNSNKTYTDGWLHTGDHGTIDENGKVHIVQPNKDLTNNEGGKVSSFEIENKLSEHPAIQEIVLITSPDLNLGEIFHAFVVLRDNCQLTEQELIDFPKKHFSISNCPQRVTFMDELPKTTSGKILKTQLGKTI